MRSCLRCTLAALAVASACSETRPPTEPRLSLRGVARETTTPTIISVTDRGFTTKARDSSDTAGAEGWSTIEYKYPALQIVDDPSAPKSPPSVAQVSFRAGTIGGVARGNAVEPFPGSGLRTVNLSMWVMLSSDWVGPSNGKSLLAEVLIAGQPRVQIVAKGVGSRDLIPAIVLGAGTPDARVRLTPNVVEAARLSRGVWHQWDVEVTANDPGIANGHVSWSLDGTKVGEYNDVTLVADGEAPAMTVYRQRSLWGTRSDTVPANMEALYDEVAISGVPVDSPQPTPAPTLEAIVLSPVSATLQAGQMQQFTALGRWSDGSTQAASVTWSATDGSISSTGLYTAGPTAGSFQVVATQTGDGAALADTATVTVTAPSAGLTGLDFLGNADGRSTMFVFNAGLSGTAPFAPFPATYIWRAYPRSGQLGYWTSLFHAHYTTGAF